MDAVSKLPRLIAVTTAAGGRDAPFENRRRGVGAPSNLVGAMTVSAGGGSEITFPQDGLAVDTLFEERNNPRPRDPFSGDDLRIGMTPGTGLVNP